MVNHAARECLVKVLQDFLAARTTNREYERAFEQVLGEHPGTDRGINAVYGFVWNLYDDFEEHRLEGGWAPEPEVAAIANRCVLFIDSSFLYQWKAASFIGLDWRRMFSRLLPWMKDRTDPVERFRQRIAEPGGEVDYWPFHSAEQYELRLAELREPILTLPPIPLSNDGQK